MQGASKAGLLSMNVPFSSAGECQNSYWFYGFCLAEVLNQPEYLI